MKWYPAMFPADKSQIETMDKVGQKERLISFYYVQKELNDNRRKIVNKKVREMDSETRKKAMEKALEGILKEEGE